MTSFLSYDLTIGKILPDLTPDSSFSDDGFLLQHTEVDTKELMMRQNYKTEIWYLPDPPAITLRIAGLYGVSKMMAYQIAHWIVMAFIFSRMT